MIVGVPVKTRAVVGASLFIGMVRGWSGLHESLVRYNTHIGAVEPIMSMVKAVGPCTMQN